MPFTVSWVDIPSSAIDPDSPVDTTLMTELRDNPDFVSQWVGVRATAAVNHAHKGAATDGTAKVAYSDITGGPPTVPLVGFINSQDVSVSKGGADGEYASGALTGITTPVLCNVMIAATRAADVRYSHGIATAATSYFIGHDLAGALISGAAMVGKSKAFGGGDLNITVSQFTNAGIKFVLPADVFAGEDIAYKVEISVVGY